MPAKTHDDSGSLPRPGSVRPGPTKRRHGPCQPRRRQRKIYRGEHVRAVAMPLGGIGTGTIAVCGDGSLRQWQIHNQVNHHACVPHSFFAVWAWQDRTQVSPIARVLQSSGLYESSGPSPPPVSSDHIVPVCHRELLTQLPGVASTEFVGEYPIAELEYHDPELPLQVRMEALNAFIPLDCEESGIPVIIFNFEVTNPTDQVTRASLAATLQNAVGWDGLAPISGTACASYGGNFNTVVRINEFTAIGMQTARLPQDDSGYGTMALAALSPDATYVTQWDDLQAAWSDLMGDGRLSNVVDATPSALGRTWNGALAVPFKLGAGQSRRVTFLIAWHFPNRFVNFTQAFMGIVEGHNKHWLGNHYCNRFRSALDVVSYVSTHLERLAAQTRLARDTLWDTSLPLPLIDAVTSQMSIIRTPTCVRTADGRFFGFEGCYNIYSTPPEAHGGSGGFNCTHVWNYEMALARLFPELERSMRETEWKIQQHPSGYLPHRVAMPLDHPRLWGCKISGPDRPALDGLLGAVVKTYREYRACGDKAWLGEMWPSVKKALTYLWAEHDPGREGIIAGEQPNTYDISIYGFNTFIGTLYLTALRAAEVMATLCGDSQSAAECKEVYRRGREAIEQRLWNGEYYVQEVQQGKQEQSWGAGCHSDQLLGQWWAHCLGLGYVLSPERVREAARAIFRYNFRESLRGHCQRPRQFVAEEDPGLLNCTWPKGGRPEVPTLYSDEVWTGIEYEVAGLLLYVGEVESALRILAATRSRYDGRKQNPWNDIECGDHYVRAMASWALLEAASGYRYDAGAAEIAFAPIISTADYRGPFVARDGWGTFAQTMRAEEQTAFISVWWGSLEMGSLRLARCREVQQIHVEVGGRDVPGSFTRTDDEVVIRLVSPVVLRAPETLQIKLS